MTDYYQTAIVARISAGRKGKVVKLKKPVTFIGTVFGKKMRLTGRYKVVRKT